MADEDDDKRKLDEAETEAEEGSPDDVVAGPGAGDPRIMTMTGAPEVPIGPGGANPEMMRRTMAAPGGPAGAPGAAVHPGFLQQLFSQIQAAHQARQAQRQQMGQQFMGSPMGQHFAQSPFGQQMLQRHPQWAPAAPAAGGGAPQNIMVGDHTGQPGPAAPPTAAQQANAEATQAKQSARQAQPEGGAKAAKQPAAAAAPQAQAQAAQRQTPRGVLQRPEQPAQRPTFGGNASASIQQEIQRRLAGGGRRGLG